MLHEKLKMVGAFSLAKSEYPTNQVGTDNYQSAIIGSGYLYSDIKGEDWYTGALIGQEIYIDAETGSDDTGDGSDGAPFETLNYALGQLDSSTTADQHAIIHLGGNSVYDLDWTEDGDNSLEALATSFTNGQGIILSGSGGYTPTIKLVDKINTNYDSDTTAKTTHAFLDIIDKSRFTWATNDVAVVGMVNGGIYYDNDYRNGYDVSDMTKISTESGTRYFRSFVAKDDVIHLYDFNSARIRKFTAPSTAMTDGSFFVSPTYLYGTVDYNSRVNAIGTVQGYPVSSISWTPEGSFPNQAKRTMLWYEDYQSAVLNSKIHLIDYDTDITFVDLGTFGLCNIGDNITKIQIRTDVFETKGLFQVVAVSTINYAISAINNGDTIGGVVVSTGQIILLKEQDDASENGVYVVGASAGQTVRHSDYNTAEKISFSGVYGPGLYDFYTFPDEIETIDVDDITFVDGLPPWGVHTNDAFTLTELQEISNLICLSKRRTSNEVYALTTDGKIYYCADPLVDTTFNLIVELDDDYTPYWRRIEVRDDGIWTYCSLPEGDTTTGSDPYTGRTDRVFGAFRDGVRIEYGNIKNVAYNKGFRSHINDFTAASSTTGFTVPIATITSKALNIIGYNIKIDGQSNKFTGICSPSAAIHYSMITDPVYGVHAFDLNGISPTGDSYVWKYQMNSSMIENASQYGTIVPQNTDENTTLPLISRMIYDKCSLGIGYAAEDSSTIQLVDHSLFYGNTIGIYTENTVNVTNTIFKDCGTDVIAGKILASNSVIKRFSSTGSSHSFSDVYTGDAGIIDAANNDFRIKTTYNGYGFDSPYIKDGALDFDSDVGPYDVSRTQSINNANYDNVIPIMWDSLTLSEAPVLTKSTLSPTGEYVEWSPNSGTTKREFTFEWNDNTSDANSDIRRNFNYVFRDLLNYRDKVFRMGFDDGSGGWKPLYTFDNIQHDTSKSGLWAIISTTNTIYKNELRGLWIYIPSLDDYMMILSNTTTDSGTINVELYNNTNLELTGVNDADPHCDYWHIVVDTKSGQKSKVWKFFANDTNAPLPIAGYSLIVHETWRDINE